MGKSQKLKIVSIVILLLIFIAPAIQASVVSAEPIRPFNATMYEQNDTLIVDFDGGRITLNPHFYINDSKTYLSAASLSVSDNSFDIDTKDREIKWTQSFTESGLAVIDKLGWDVYSKEPFEVIGNSIFFDRYILGFDDLEMFGFTVKIVDVNEYYAIVDVTGIPQNQSVLLDPVVTPSTGGGEGVVSSICPSVVRVDSTTLVGVTAVDGSTNTDINIVKSTNNGAAWTGIDTVLSLTNKDDHQGCIFYDSTNSKYAVVYHNKTDNNQMYIEIPSGSDVLVAANWSQAVGISQTDTANDNPAACDVNSTSGLHCIYRDEAAKNLQWTSCPLDTNCADIGNWSTPSSVYGTGSYNYYEIDFDDSDNIYAAWNEKGGAADGDINISIYNGSSWSTPLILSENITNSLFDNGTGIGLNVDYDNNVSVVFFEYFSANTFSVHRVWCDNTTSCNSAANWETDYNIMVRDRLQWGDLSITHDGDNRLYTFLSRASAGSTTDADMIVGYNEYYADTNSVWGASWKMTDEDPANASQYFSTSDGPDMNFIDVFYIDTNAGTTVLHYVNLAIQPLVGAPPPSASTPVVEVVNPNGGEEYEVDSTITIDFNMLDADSNGLITAGLYYSTSSGNRENSIVDLNVSPQSFDESATGLIFGVHFDDTNRDIEGNLAFVGFGSGTDYNMVDYNAGRILRGFDINGDKSGIAYDNNVDNEPNLRTAQGTVAFWIKNREADQTSTNVMLWDYRHVGSVGDQIYLKKDSANADDLTLFIDMETGTDITCENNSAWDFSDGLWHFIVAIWDVNKVGNYSCGIYVDKILVASDTTTTVSVQERTDGFIGIGATFLGLAAAAPFDDTFEGTIDEFQVFNIVVSETDINRMFDDANAAYANCPGLDGNTATEYACAYNWDATGVSTGNYYIDINATDESANTGTDSSDATFSIIVTNPFMTGVDLNEAYAKNGMDMLITAAGVGDDGSDTNVSLVCGFAADPTLATADFCIDYGNSSPYSSVSCVGQGVAGDGSDTVYCRLYDDANYSIDQNTDTYIRDNTAPSTSDDINAGYQNFDANVALSCTDGSGSGCDATYYQLDTDSGNGVTYGDFQLYDSNVFFGTDGNWAISYNSIDNVDNNETAKIDYVLIDKVSPTVVVNIPNGGETYEVGDLVNIDFNVLDSHSKDIFASIYYSSSAGAFTNLIIADLNLTNYANDANITCADTNWENSTACDYNWGTGVVSEASYFIDVNVYNDWQNQNTDSSNAKFDIGRRLRFQFYDENTGVGLPDVFVTIDGNIFTADANGLITIDTTNWAAKFYSVEAFDANHATRQWQWDLNDSVALTLDLALLDTNKGTTINFQFFDENGFILNDANVDFFIDGDKYASIKRLDSSGKTSAFLNPNDFNYTFRIVQSDINIYLYSPTLVTVKVPRDEETNVVLPVGEDINYSISVDGIGARLFTNLSADVSFYMLSDTFDNYIITVDYNSGYYERKFHIRLPGNPDTFELQPYLVKSTETSTTLTTQSIITFQPIPNVTVKIYKDLPGAGRTLIETVVTDSKGEALISGITNDTYDFEVYYNGVLIGQPSITVTSTTIIIQFNPLPISPITEGAYAEVYFYPPFSRLSKDNNNLDQNTNSYQVNIESVHIFVVEDGNTILYDQTFSNLDVNFHNNSIDVVNDLSAWDVNNFIDVYVDITLDGGFIIRRQMRYWGYDVNITSLGILYIMQNTIYETMGCEAPDPLTGDTKPCGNLYLISLFITIGICATVVSRTPYRDPIGMSVFAVIIMGFFVFLTWINVYWLVFFALISFGAMVVAWRVS